MTTYGLIHGAWHGSWWWGPVAERIRARGHEVVAPELPCDDTSVTFSGYAEIVADALSQAGDDVVLVASSLAGLTAPLVPRLRPVREIVFVGAYIAIPGMSFDEQFRTGDAEMVRGATAGVARDDQDRSFWADHDELVRVLYHDVDPELTREAIPRLRPQATQPYAEPCPLDAFPEVPVRSIVCAGDRIVPVEWSRRVARERFGVEAIELEGGHMPMLARPDQLVEAILA